MLCTCGDPSCKGEHDLEVVELEDENGQRKEFVILDELDFEERHICIMAPLAEVQAIDEAEGEARETLESNLTIDIYEVKDDGKGGENFQIIEDEEFGKRLVAHFDTLEEAEEKA
jgi:hypothetical protein